MISAATTACGLCGMWRRAVRQRFRRGDDKFSKDENAEETVSFDNQIDV